MSADLERAAVKLAVEGFKVIPLQPGRKRPLEAGWQAKFTDDPVTVAETWRRHPTANIGVRTGGGIFVLDVDSYKPQCKWDMELPATTTVRTARGGHHYYFAGFARTAENFRPAVDIRGPRALVVGAGSRVGDGIYEWEVPPWELAPQSPPAELVKLIRERAQRRAFDQGPIPEGRRNSSLTQIAGHFVHNGISGEPLALALHEVNRRRCKPPLSEQEVDGIVKSASKWGAAPPWVIDPLSYVEDRRLDAKSHLLLMTLAQRADAEGMVRGGGWLQQATALSRNSIGRAVADLERFKRIEVLRKRRVANLYRLLPSPSPHPPW